MSRETGDQRVIAYEVSLRHFIEQFISVLEQARFRVEREKRVPRTRGLVWKIIKGILGTFYAAALGIRVDESVGEERVEKKRGFDKVRVHGRAKLQAFRGDTLGNQRRVLFHQGTDSDITGL